MIATRLRKSWDASDTTRPVWLQVCKAPSDRTWSYEVTGPGGAVEVWQVTPGRGKARAPRYNRVDASARLLSPAAGIGWVAVGDASASFDPIASQGLFHALSTALVACGAFLSGAFDEAVGPMAYSEAMSCTFEASEAARLQLFRPEAGFRSRHSAGG
jgi:hypothetical protein